ncbi:MAG TPA: ATP synthase F1 subunit gamma [Polyangiaceae bacterium]|nr:ATP synthase F1 subunit gamma [Polyangiaceae bacterium]
MASLKAIRTRISSVKSTQKITRAMKMVAGARLNRAQQRIVELRPYAVKTQEALSEIVSRTLMAIEDGETHEAQDGHAPALDPTEATHPLLVRRQERRVLLLVLTSDRGLCGAFNSNINKNAEREYRERTAKGQDVRVVVVGRKGRDYFARRSIPIEPIPNIWDKLTYETSKRVGDLVLAPFLKGDVDAIYVVYNEFKSAMSQQVVVEPLLPVPPVADTDGLDSGDFLFEPSRTALLEHLAPLYVDISILRALYESMASELGARMTAMDAATKNATEMIDRLTLEYNKARQAAITKELMEIIGGSEALKE